jgi:hypothetical protein
MITSDLTDALARPQTRDCVIETSVNHRQTQEEKRHGQNSADC